MKAPTRPDARRGSSPPEQTFADAIPFVRRGQSLAGILPVAPQRRLRDLESFLEGQAMKTVPSETLLAEAREAHA
jgi:hypothetical protein